MGNDRKAEGAQRVRGRRGIEQEMPKRERYHAWRGLKCLESGSEYRYRVAMGVVRLTCDASLGTGA